MDDRYSAYALPVAVLEAVRSEEARIVARLVDVTYEIPGTLLAYRRVMVPMLTYLAYAVDPAGAPTEEWTREYVAKRAGMEADVIVEGATGRAAQGLAFASSHYREAREAFHKNERATNVQSKA